MTREITILTPESVELKFELAGLGSRFLAILIDSLVQAGALVVISLAMVGVGNITDIGIARIIPGSWLFALLILLLFSTWTGYFLFFEVTRNGQTPGKKLLGIRVIRDTGHPVDFRSGLLRNVMRAVDALPTMYGVGIISMFLSPQYRRLGDYAAGTLVVKVRKHEQSQNPSASKRNPESYASLANVGTAAYLLPDELLARLDLITREDYRAIRHFLDRQHELESSVVERLARRLAEPFAERLGAQGEFLTDPVDFLSRLAAEWERRMIR
ncbi:MAG: RDD family protein [Armatimonadota bacterium]